MSDYKLKGSLSSKSALLTSIIGGTMVPTGDFIKSPRGFFLLYEINEPPLNSTYWDWGGWPFLLFFRPGKIRMQGILMLIRFYVLFAKLVSNS